MENLLFPAAWCIRRASAKYVLFRDWCRARDYHVIELDFGDDFLEGHGDLLWHPDGSRIYAGYGFRSTRGGVEKFSAAMAEMGIPVVPLHSVDPYCYHLDTCLCPLNNEAALIFRRGVFRRGARAAAQILEAGSPAHRRRGSSLHGQRNRGQRHYITPYLTPQLEAILDQEGLTPVLVDTSEFEKAGGSCFCMKTFLP